MLKLFCIAPKKLYVSQYSFFFFTGKKENSPWNHVLSLTDFFFNHTHTYLCTKENPDWSYEIMEVRIILNDYLCIRWALPA